MQAADIDVLAQAATAPLYLTIPDAARGKSYNTHPPMLRKPAAEREFHFSLAGLNMIAPMIAKAFVCLAVAPMVFAWPLTLLTFSGHFHFPTLIWFGVALGLLPVALAFLGAQQLQRNFEKSTADRKWGWVTFALFLIAFLLGTFLGDVNYLLFMRHYYFITSLKAYTDIDPSKVQGMQLMDAGRIQFSSGTRVLRDMGMSYTSWDIYCVAPISRQSSSTGEEAGQYDMWAVGKNCCKSDDPTFACGEAGNADARAGLRQVNEDERQYFALAVQQAKAEYNIQSEHPLFFHWVEDPDSNLGLFFAAGFKMWVFSLFMMLGINGLLVMILQYLFRPPPVGLIPK